MWVQPILTANGTIGTSEFAVASGGGADSDAYKAFDSSASSYVNKMNSGAWLKFFSQTWLAISDIVITSEGSLPSQGIFQVSYDNGVTWQQCGSWQDTTKKGTSAHVVINNRVVTGQYFRFVSQGRSLANPNNNADFCNVTITAEAVPESTFIFFADVQRKLSNNIEVNADLERILRQKWRYTNAGTADDLIITGTTLTDLPADKSVTGSAFYQTTRAKCFDLPTTEEIWIKFDVYFDGSNRWRAYNGKDGATCGVCSYVNYSDGDFGMWQNSNRVQDWLGICKTNQLQTVLLHMTAGSSDGIVEAWVDGEKIYTYTGDVNHGEDFADIYLQSDGVGTFFSNVIISNYQIGLNDGYQIFTADVQRKIANAVEVNADLQLNVIAPIVVPFIGEHFNHYVPNVTIFRDVPQPIILPKKSDVFIRADGNGIVKIFSDTDAEGIISTSIYAELADCKTVYVTPAVSATPPDEMKISKLLISDGGIDSNYNALTDNTRQIFSPTIERTLIKSTEFAADIMIQDVFSINLIADLFRNLITTFKLYETDNSEYFSGGTSAPVVIPSQEIIPPQENVGLQSIEISIAEQQLTDSVKIVTVIPLDVMFPVRGQYFDYFYDMRVERVQQRGVLFSADCCSDIDALLYTQMAYSLPSEWIWQMQWRKVGEEPVTQKIKTHYPPASAHVTRIADALGLSPVIQFDDFLSTVLMDDLGGVTYADLIRDLFGWSSRVPTMLINAYIRGDKLFVIQRGHESNVIDITGADMTLPTITREILRTAWGSSLWSKTETREMPVYNVPDDEIISGGGGSGDDSGGSEENVHEISTQFNGKLAQGYTTYKYNRRGQLIQTYTYVHTKATGQNTYTIVNHNYDDDGTMIYTETRTQSIGSEGDSDNLSIDEKGYVILNNGEKFLAWEHIAKYRNDDGLGISNKDLIDEQYTSHSPSRVGQKHVIKIASDGEVIGEVVGQDTGDDRVTPFAVRKSRDLIRAVQSGNSSGSGSGSDGWTTETQSRTLNGISLYDSSFPIHNEDKLIAITEELKRLNRRTQETVTFALYNFPHLIDFNDRVILNGIEYFLVNNTASTTPRLFNEQNLTLRRWV